MDDSETEQCPICMQSFPIAVLLEHAPNCGGIVEDENNDLELARKLQSEYSQGKNETEDADAVLARKLYEEDQKKSKSPEKAGSSKSTFPCSLGKHETKLDSLYILDECSCKFCIDCIKEYVIKEISQSVSVPCPNSSCKALLSIRDMNELLPKLGGVGKKRPLDGSLKPKTGGKQATERLHQELRLILKSNPKTQGYEVQPIDDNLYHWEIKLFGFEDHLPIAQDLKAFKVPHVLMHITFNKDYPFSAPFMRVIRPRFAYRTGHITIGGSICNEMLVRWLPSTTIESCIISVRIQLLEGNARLDNYNRSDYTEGEAKVAFDRMVATHPEWQQ
eukprot:TRINITY_DN2029_c0_g1_i1.p1 TRINITY_DN2029_c0_g1~~TRINITY_DN2029_c0_g1_i1.p1  ORF type:complete len:333 (-),score=37.11 TRINITY_DN2029_c0_g1_i1:132-1130(-)